MSLPTTLKNHWQSIAHKLEHSSGQAFVWQNFYAALDTEKKEQLQKVLCISEYFVREFVKDHEYLLKAIISGEINKPCSSAQFSLWLDEFLAGIETEDSLQRALRLLRRRAMLFIIWYDSLKLGSLTETTQAASDLADVCINRSIRLLTELFSTRYGHALGKQSKAVQPFMVLGMGKLGAYELNLSSDIDLIFIYPESGQTDGKKCLSNQEYFTRLGQKLIQTLDKITADGFVFRVDMRLRPYGQSGPLVMNFASFEEYYQEQGRDWERYAMVKARIVTGEQSLEAKKLLTTLKPFVYRHYIDFGAIEALRKMKAMIRSEVRRRNLENNVKLGAGGIREVEFIVQTFQLIRGGQDLQLQERGLIKMLDILAGEGHLPAKVCAELKEAYVFLRNSEHALQALNDEQTQTLPEDSIEQARLALSMQFESFESYTKALTQHRNNVSHHFSQIISTEHEDEQSEENPHWQNLWLGDMNENAQQEFIEAHPHAEAQNMIKALDEFRKSKALQVMQPIGRERLNALMPLLLAEIWQQKHALQCLTRILPLIETVSRRTAYLALLNENPQALKQLVSLFHASSWVAQYIIHTPILLDELLTPANLNKLPEKSELSEELRLRLLRIEENDEEQQLEQLRQFVRARKLYAAASEVMGILTVMQTSDYLTYLSEVILEAVLELSWAQMVKKYGHPRDKEKQPILEPEFIIIGYGKIGGIEMSYSSDLDLVFLHDSYSQGETDGKRSISNQVFYTRLGQRIIHIMSTQTHTGQLYEVDMRLRPSGNSGPITISVEAFEKYQKSEAWTWEHQALIRARCICGHKQLAQKFDAIRGQILVQKRELDSLKKDVKEMREKMREHLGSESKSKNRFELKQDFGGIVDIEFLVQYSVLAYAHTHTNLVDVTDNMRLLDTIAQAGLLNPKDCQTLQETYLTYRAETHRRALQKQSLLMDEQQIQELEFDGRRQQVIALWQKILGSP